MYDVSKACCSIDMTKWMKDMATSIQKRYVLMSFKGYLPKKNLVWYDQTESEMETASTSSPCAGSYSFPGNDCRHVIS